MPIDSGLVAIIISVGTFVISVAFGLATRRPEARPYNDYEAQLREQRAEIARLTTENQRLRAELDACLQARAVGE